AFPRAIHEVDAPRALLRATRWTERMGRACARSVTPIPPATSDAVASRRSPTVVRGLNASPFFLRLHIAHPGGLMTVRGPSFRRPEDRSGNRCVERLPSRARFRYPEISPMRSRKFLLSACCVLSALVVCSISWLGPATLRTEDRNGDGRPDV